MRFFVSILLFALAANASADWSSLRAILSKYTSTRTITSPAPSPTPTAPTPTAPTEPAPTTPTTPTTPAATWWKPSPFLRWQIQYTGKLDTSYNVDAYNIDLFDNSAANISMLKAQGKKVICYFSAGSYENWRPDASRFPAAVLGKNLDGWPGERWLDVRNLAALGPIMTARLDMARSKGCDAVDPDNVDGYIQNSGFAITGAHQITYNRFLADEAHKRGLAIGLKNDVDQVVQLEPYFDFAVNEECYKYNECRTLLPFIKAGKPVLHIEYDRATSTFCPSVNQLGFSSVRKNLSLDSFVQFCR